MSRGTDEASEHGRASVWFLVAVAALAVGLGIWWFTLRSEPTDPTTVELPAPANIGKTERYLDNRGKALMSLEQLVDRVKDDSPDWCTPEVEAELSAIGTPARLATAAASVPDRALGDMWLTLLRSLTLAVAACDQGASARTAAEADVQFAAVVLHRALDAHSVT